MARIELRSFHTKIVGVTFSNANGTSRQSLLGQCRLSERVQLIPEPTNRQDPNAVKVCRLSGAQLGYLRRELADENPRSSRPRLDRPGGDLDDQLLPFGHCVGSAGMGQTGLLVKLETGDKNCEWIYRFRANPGRPWGGIVPPSPVLAPGSALRSRPRVALSSAQVLSM